MTNTTISPLVANLCGGLAILLWSSSALVFTYCANIPPIMLSAQISLVGFLIFVVAWLFRGERISDHFKLSWKVVLFCVVGIGGYRLVYLVALGMAPVVEASLLNYLWPLLIVLFSRFLPDHRIKTSHVFGAVLGFLGVGILLFDPETMFRSIQLGHILAIVAAVIWGAYSVGTRTMKAYSSNAVPISFLYSGLITLIFAWVVEPQVPVAWSEYAFMVLLAVVTGVGYFLWDIAMKSGHIQILGIASYLTPLLSTVLLIFFSKAEASPDIILATALIVAGPIIASQRKVRSALQEWREKRGG